MALPETKTLILDQQGPILHILLNRPETRNAMSGELVGDLIAVFDSIKDDASVRGVVIRGAGGSFCAGADLKDMTKMRVQAAADGDSSIYAKFNRGLGGMLIKVDQAPQVVVVVLEGAVLGGGFGLACISDVALTLDDTKFGLPETGLGLPPAQIAPYVVQRVGLTQARRLALLGSRFEGQEAVRVGLAHESFATVDELNAGLDKVLKQIKRTAPNATRVTKELLFRAAALEPIEGLLDDAAQKFATAATTEGLEGTLAFVEKRLPNWAV